MVPVLLPNVAKDAVETLISAREAVGVPGCSLLLFAKTNGKKVSGWHALKKFCQAAGVKKPEVHNRHKHEEVPRHHRPGDESP